jgi:hypothetical protein
LSPETIYVAKCDAENIFELLIIHYQELKLDKCSTSKAKRFERSVISELQPNQIIMKFLKLDEGPGLRNTDSKEQRPSATIQ